MSLTQQQIEGLYELVYLKPKLKPVLLTGTVLMLIGSVCLCLGWGSSDGVFFGFNLKEYLPYFGIGLDVLAFVAFSYWHAVFDRILELEVLLSDY